MCAHDLCVRPWFVFMSMSWVRVHDLAVCPVNYPCFVCMSMSCVSVCTAIVCPCGHDFCARAPMLLLLLRLLPLLLPPPFPLSSLVFPPTLAKYRQASKQARAPPSHVFASLSRPVLFHAFPSHDLYLVHCQFAEALTIISKVDFPARWPNLIQDLVGLMKTSGQVKRQKVATFFGVSGGPREPGGGGGGPGGPG